MLPTTGTCTADDGRWVGRSGTGFGGTLTTISAMCASIDGEIAFGMGTGAGARGRGLTAGADCARCVANAGRATVDDAGRLAELRSGPDMRRLTEALVSAVRNGHRF